MDNETLESRRPVNVSEGDTGLSYVLITPARNEAEFIGLALKSMAEQEIPPLKWVIVSDGSTDGTDDMVMRYAAEYDWIELVRMPERTERNFAGKVHAFNEGYARVSDLQFDVVGNLDADTSFGKDHFKFLLSKFAENPLLGVAGTAFIEGAGVKYNYDIVNIEDVQGQCQLFRRKCFEEIGGYVPIKGGGVDVVPVYTARMMGWETRTFTERTYVHHRIAGTAECSFTVSMFNSGKKDYYLGGHPLWEILRSIYQMRKKPYIVRGCVLFFGYIWAFLRKMERPISSELVKFRRKEQMRRLANMMRGIV